jgi:2-amino-4-hydroxy-6-hydroxymethyldihydropteridine diphosphokinase
MSVAYLSLGSNLGDRAANIRECISRLKGCGKVAGISSLYETEPMELLEQPWFVNCAVELETSLSPHELLACIQTIEADLGRNRVVDKGPRTIDVDILLYDELIVDEPALQIPHPAMNQRRFVLGPLSEIAPQVLHPRLDKSVAQMLAELRGTSGQVRRLSG